MPNLFQASSVLAEVVGSRCQQDGITETSVNGLRLYRSSMCTPRQPVVYTPTICIVAQGRKQVHVGNQTYGYDPDNYLINSLIFPMEAEVLDASPELPYLGLSLEIDNQIVGQLMLDMSRYDSDAGIIRAGQNTELVSASSLNNQLLQQIIRLVELEQNVMDRQILGGSLKREIFYEVLKGPQGGMLRNCINNHVGAHRVAHVIHYIEQNYKKPLDIEMISSVANMSHSSLHDHFKEVTSMSPMQFVKSLRLHQARLLLLEGTSVAEACYSVGYSSHSQFSREFKRLFGESPKSLLVNAVDSLATA